MIAPLLSAAHFPAKAGGGFSGGENGFQWGPTDTPVRRTPHAMPEA